MTYTWQGGCHCGTIRYRYESPTDITAGPIRACSCSFCTKIRAAYTSHPDAKLEISIGSMQRVNRYRFGTSTADFHICRQCGGMPFVTSDIEGTRYAVLNVNSLDGNPCAHSEILTADLEGETTENRLARRQRGWIGHVAIREESI